MNRKPPPPFLVAAALLLAGCGPTSAGHGGGQPAGGLPGGVGGLPSSPAIDPATISSPGPDGSSDTRSVAAPSSGGGRTGGGTRPPSRPGSTPTPGAGGGAPGSPPSSGGGGCPDPRYCPDYNLQGGQWPTSSGQVVIHYRINPSGYQGNTPLTPQQFIDAVNTAAQTWADADPAVRLIYDGTTTASPGTYKSSGWTGNYNNVVGFDTTTVNGAATDIPTSGTYSGFDIRVKSTSSWTWTPCHPPGQPCADTGDRNSDDIQPGVTHEWGHVLGLGHVTASGDTLMTMNPGVSGTGYRFSDTLALGDVLGVRHLYPTSAPMPTIYDP